MALLTVRDAAALLGVGYSTLKQWIYAGRVRTTRTAGGHHRITAEEVERLLSAHGRTRVERSAQRPAGDTIVAISGRNRLRGVVEEIRLEGVLAQVRLGVGGQHLTAVITRDAVEELHLRAGDEATAIIKATEVMLARESNGGGRHLSRRKGTREP